MTFSYNISTVCVNYMQLFLTRHSSRSFCCVPACRSRPFGISFWKVLFPSSSSSAAEGNQIWLPLLQHASDAALLYVERLTSCSGDSTPAYLSSSCPYLIMKG